MERRHGCQQRLLRCCCGRLGGAGQQLLEGGARRIKPLWSAVWGLAAAAARCRRRPGRLQRGGKGPGVVSGLQQRQRRFGAAGSGAAAAGIGRRCRRKRGQEQRTVHRRRRHGCCCCRPCVGVRSNVAVLQGVTESGEGAGGLQPMTCSGGRGGEARDVLPICPGSVKARRSRHACSRWPPSLVVRWQPRGPRTGDFIPRCK